MGGELAGDGELDCQAGGAAPGPLSFAEDKDNVGGDSIAQGRALGGRGGAVHAIDEGCDRGAIGHGLAVQADRTEEGRGNARLGRGKGEREGECSGQRKE